VDYSAGSVLLSNAEGIEIDDFSRQRLVRCRAVQSHVQQVEVHAPLGPSQWWPCPTALPPIQNRVGEPEQSRGGAISDVPAQFDEELWFDRRFRSVQDEQVKRRAAIGEVLDGAAGAAELGLAKGARRR
jgi:hypothetical protein